jgi:hypothetical protein
MPPETTILKVNNAPAAALVHHFGTCVFVVLESIQYSNPTYWSESYREPPRSTIGIAAVLTAIEYEYRFTEYRFAEYEYDEIRCEARSSIRLRQVRLWSGLCASRRCCLWSCIGLGS